MFNDVVKHYSPADVLQCQLETEPTGMLTNIPLICSGDVRFSDTRQAFAQKQAADAQVPTPKPIVAPAKDLTVNSGNVEQWRWLAEQYDWPVNQALAIMQAESGGNPNATHLNHNGSVDKGLWQINSVHGNQNWYDPKINADEAYLLYVSAGRSWRPWTTARGLGLL